MDAAEIYRTIDQQRSYLGQWLPFVATTQSVNDSLDFINSILKAAEEKDVCVFTIRYKDAFAGIIGLKGTDFANKKTEIGYWLAEEYQGLGMRARWRDDEQSAFCRFRSIQYAQSRLAQALIN